MPATAWLRRNALEVGWALFALANLAVVVVWPAWIRLPFDLIWISLAFVYSIRLWSVRTTAIVLSCLSGGLVLVGVVLASPEGDEMWGRLVAIPFLCTIFAAMVWQAERRKAAVRSVETVADTRASLLERQERFLNDASHELRTPVTIARGHLELLRREQPDAPEIAVALDELERIERIVGRVLLLAQAEQPDFLMLADVEIDSFVEDVFMRWSEVAPRAWRLGVDVTGVVRADPEALRSALDALLENAVKYTEAHDLITLRAYAGGGEVVIEVADEGCGVPPDALDRIFDRFARADNARTRTQGGAGLGLSIADAIAKAHGGRCTVTASDRGATFALRLPVGVQPEVGAQRRSGAARGRAGLARVERGAERRDVVAQRVWALLGDLHRARADDDAVGDFGERTRMLGRRDAEARVERQARGRERARALDERPEPRGDLSRAPVVPVSETT